MRVAIHQPAYIPWLPYFDKIKQSDVFVYLDTVQYVKNYYDNRNKISIDGRERWLTIPILTSGHFGQKLYEARPANYKWINQHLNLLRQAYKKEDNFDKNYGDIERIYESIRRWSEKDWLLSLSDINYIMLLYYTHLLDISTKIVRASEISETFVKGIKSDLVLNICKHFSATEYYSGVGAKDYLDEESFKQNHVKIIYQDYKPVHNLSILHSIFTNQL